MVMNTPYVAQQTVDDYGQPFSTLMYSATLASNVDTTLTIPGNSPRYKALIKANTPVWVALNDVADNPIGATFLPTTSEITLLNRGVCREVKSGDVLHFLSTSPASVSVVLYSMYTTS